MTEPTIGDRIRELRKPLYTQDDLAAAAEVSVDVIRKLEQGRRRTTSIPTLARIAHALNVDIAALLGPSRPALPGANQAPVVAIRDALTSVDALLGELDDAEAPELTELGRAVSYAWGLYYAGRYGQLARLLPRLLGDAQAATHAATVAGSGRAVDLAAQIHQITAVTLVRLDAADLGHTAAREALRLAAQAPDPLRAASVWGTFGHVLLIQGRFIDAERIAMAAAEQVQPSSGQASTAQLSVYGGLLLGGATAAARQGRAGAATDLLGEAATVAQRTGMDRTDYDVVFGPSNVVMQSTDCSVVAEDYVRAAEVARRMLRNSSLPLAARSRHLVDVAHVQLRLGHTQAAELTLLTMEQAAPEWTARHRLPRMLAGELITRGRPSARLRELAQRLNAAPVVNCQ
jgi:transcriptional regulator with XRE-family HTH domain